MTHDPPRPSSIRVRRSTPPGAPRRWVAYLDADPSVAGAGPSIWGAIGAMVRGNPGVFGEVAVAGDWSCAPDKFRPLLPEISAEQIPDIFDQMLRRRIKQDATGAA
jgi:hypothetical protein